MLKASLGFLATPLSDRGRETSLPTLLLTEAAVAADKAKNPFGKQLRPVIQWS